MQYINIMLPQQQPVQGRVSVALARDVAEQSRK